MSDVDTRTIIIPSLEDLVQRKNTSEIVEISNGLSDIKDIKTMFNQFYKSNPAYLELLISDYMVFSPFFKSEFEELVENADLIASRDKKALVYASYGIMTNKMSALANHSGTNKEEIAKYGYNSKNTSHVLRVNEFIHRFLSGENFKSSLNAKNYDCYEEILSIRNREYDFKEVQKICKKAYQETALLCEKQYEKPDQNIEKMLNDIAYRVIKLNLSVELND